MLERKNESKLILTATLRVSGTRVKENGAMKREIISSVLVHAARREQ